MPFSQCCINQKSILHYLSVIPQVPNKSSAYRPHCRCRIMSISSCSLSMKMCCMQPWKRFSFVSHFLIVLLVFGQPVENKKVHFFFSCEFKRTDLFAPLGYLQLFEPHPQKSSGPQFEWWRGWWSSAAKLPPRRWWESGGCLWLPNPPNASNHHLACILRKMTEAVMMLWPDSYLHHSSGPVLPHGWHTHSIATLNETHHVLFSHELTQYMEALMRFDMCLGQNATGMQYKGSLLIHVFALL